MPLNGNTVSGLGLKERNIAPKASQDNFFRASIEDNTSIINQFHILASSLDYTISRYLKLSRAQRDEGSSENW
jgi:hypothetical protein